ncbi:MAG TPA: c-type cytochrome [Thermoanaerobaculia bacterium]
MKKILKRTAIVVPVTIVLLITSALGYAHVTLSREVDVPLPDIKADMRPEARAKGAAIFHSMCEGCHREPDSDRAAGAHMKEVPSFLGEFHSANLTHHKTAGIGGLSDGQVARQIRFAVNRHNQRTIMPSLGMSDEDLAAVIGYLRSDDPLFAPDAKVNPRSRLSPQGKFIALSAGGLRVPDRPANGIVAPPKAANVEWGRYLAEQVYDCGGCHTAGFGHDKLQKPGAYAGGGEFLDPAGQPVQTANITFAKTGLATFTPEQFHLAVIEGVRPDGTTLRVMPRFRGLDETDTLALYKFLSTVPKFEKQIARTAAPPAKKGDDPSKMFASLGCTSCHGQGAQFEAKLQNAKGKNVEDVARWIRHPEQFKPGTPMPTYASLLAEEDAIRLAQWVTKR